jgi:membrane-associated PAP2 superfamily phosphatase
MGFAVWTMHFLVMSKRPTNASLIQCIGAFVGLLLIVYMGV